MEQPKEENVEYHIEIQNCPDGVETGNGDVMFVLDLGGADIPENLAMTLAQWAANGSFDDSANITVRNDLSGVDGQVMHIESGNNIVLEEETSQPQVIHVQMEDDAHANGLVESQIRLNVEEPSNKEESLLTGRVPGTKTPMIIDLGDKSSKITTVFNSKRMLANQQGSEGFGTVKNAAGAQAEKPIFPGFRRGRTPVMLNLSEEQDKLLESNIRQSQNQILLKEGNILTNKLGAPGEVQKAPMILDFNEEKIKLEGLSTVSASASEPRKQEPIVIPSVDNKEIKEESKDHKDGTKESSGETKEENGATEDLSVAEKQDDPAEVKSAVQEESEPSAPQEAAKPSETDSTKTQEPHDHAQESEKEEEPEIMKKSCKHEGCDYETEDHLDYSSHLDKVHQDPLPFCCFHCDKAFKIKLTLLIHQILHIKNPKPNKTKRGPYTSRIKSLYFQCPLCPVKKKLKKQMQAHAKEEHYLNEMFTCDTCKFVCFSETELADHKKTTSHETDNRTFCDICKQSFTNIYQHKAAVHSTERPFLCNQCGYAAKTKSSLKYHMVTHLDSKDWACPTCPYKSNSQRRLKRHMKIHDPNKKHLCSQCAFATHDAYEYKRHFAKVHSRTKSFTCKFCSQTFTQHHEIRLHLIFEHDCNDAFFCTYCEFTCATRAEYKQHIQVHYGKNKHVCEICGFTGRYRTHYRRHMLTHTSNKPFTCPICKKSVREASNLRRHMLTHSDEKPLACSVCGYRCKIRSRLMNHMKTHAELRPFACHLCSYTTKFNGNLVKHLEYHAKYKPHKCSFCSYSCNERNKLKRHMNFRHKGMVIPKEEDMEIASEIKTELVDGELVVPKDELVNVILPSKDEFVIMPKEDLVIVSKDGLDIDSVITLTEGVGVTAAEGVDGTVVLTTTDVSEGGVVSENGVVQVHQAEEAMVVNESVNEASICAVNVNVGVTDVQMQEAEAQAVVAVAESNTAAVATSQEDVE